MFALHAESVRSGLPVDELAGIHAELSEQARRQPTYTRRQVIATGATIAAGAVLARSPAASFARTPSKRPTPRIAIVGAGLAGLRCAHMLWTQNPARPVASTVYEANEDRAGGRCWTLRDYFADGLITEHGGSFLNSNQTAVRRLAALLGLQEEVVNGGDLPSGDEVYFIDGRHYTFAEANADWGDFAFEAFRAALTEKRTEAGEARLDGMSVPEWLDSTPIGAHSKFGKLMMANTVTENGGDPAEQSALDLIEVIGHNPRSSVVPLPGDDERFHVEGGNDQMVSGMIGELPPGTIQHGFELVAVRANSDGRITLSFDAAGATTDVTADHVVFALPFSILRSVDLSRSELSATKRKVINTLGMGSNAKIHLELSHKTWPALGFSGATYGEWHRLACAWDDSVPLGPDARPALYLAFPGGRVGKTGITGVGHGSAPVIDVEFALRELEHVFPGTTAAFTGLAYEDHWAADPWVKGAYSYYRVGQASEYGSLAAAAEGRYLFAGEHTSIANQGFLDGAVETGERAARRLLRLVS
jgi:monoamine oxidase